MAKRRDSQKEQALERERSRLQTLIDAMADEVWFCDADGNLTLLNQAALRALGLEAAEERYDTLSDLLAAVEFFNVDGQPRSPEEAPLYRALAGERLTGVEEIMQRPETPESRRREVNAAPIKSGSGEIIGAVAVIRDLTEAKQTEASLRRAGEIFEALNQWHRLLIEATAETDILLEMCRIIIEIGGYHSVWIGYAEQDEARQVKPVAHMCLDEEGAAAMNISPPNPPDLQYPAGNVIRTGKSILISHLETDAAYALWRDEALRRGYRAMIALPLKTDGHSFGVLNIYAARPDVFSNEEVELLEKMARNLAYGIRILRQKLEA